MSPILSGQTERTGANQYNAERMMKGRVRGEDKNFRDI